jgi:hypothetical protein
LGYGVIWKLYCLHVLRVFPSFEVSTCSVFFKAPSATSSSSMSKRSFKQFLADQPVLQIRLANNDGEPLTPHKTVVQLFSTCAAGLPAEPAADAAWDLSNVRVDGEPVSRPVVVAWLNGAYRCGSCWHLRTYTLLMCLAALRVQGSWQFSSTLKFHCQQWHALSNAPGCNGSASCCCACCGKQTQPAHQAVSAAPPHS